MFGLYSPFFRHGFRCTDAHAYFRSLSFATYHIPAFHIEESVKDNLLSRDFDHGMDTAERLADTILRHSSIFDPEVPGLPILLRRVVLFLERRHTIHWQNTNIFPSQRRTTVLMDV